MNRQFPCLEISRSRLRHNMEEVISRCTARGIQVCGVIKGCSGLPEVGRMFRDCGATQLASSRLEQIVRCRRAGVPGPYMLLRIPMESELEDVARWCDYSLESERATLDALEEACARQGAAHKAVVMADLGDLREGFWDREELISAAMEVEQKLENLDLLGVGTNLGCYGSVQATPEKMEELISAAEAVEAAIGRRLEVISGGASSSVHMVLDGTMPSRINHLRVGELLLLGRVWGCDMPELHKDVFTLRAEVIEVKIKPSHPVGELSVDAFGRTRTYVDRGHRRRALLAMGRVDYGECEDLVSREPGLIMLGASSDHTLVDVQNTVRDIQVGDILEFDLCYATMVYLTHSESVHLVFREETTSE